MEKIYLAGFDVFYPDATKRFERMKQLCKLSGVDALVPLDNIIDGELDVAKAIYTSNIALLDSADGVLANLNSFRGTEPDSGTVFEVGYAVAKGKKVVGYTSITNWKDHVKQNMPQSYMSGLFSMGQEPKFTIEDFGLPLNLMLAKSIHIVNGDFIDALEKYKDLKNNGSMHS